MKRKTERRSNWKEEVAEEQRQHDAGRQQILIDMENNRKALHHVHDNGLDFKKYNALKFQQRYLMAKLATL